MVKLRHKGGSLRRHMACVVLLAMLLWNGVAKGQGNVNACAEARKAGHTAGRLFAQNPNGPDFDRWSYRDISSSTPYIPSDWLGDEIPMGMLKEELHLNRRYQQETHVSRSGIVTHLYFLLTAAEPGDRFCAFRGKVNLVDLIIGVALVRGNKPISGYVWGRSVFSISSKSETANQCSGVC